MVPTSKNKSEAEESSTALSSALNKYDQQEHRASWSLAAAHKQVGVKVSDLLSQTNTTIFESGSL